MKHIFVVLCIIAIAYLYKHNVNDVKSVVYAKNICPPPSRIRMIKPADLPPNAGRVERMVYEQKMLQYKSEEKKALDIDLAAQEKLRIANKGKPCHKKEAKKQVSPDDLLDQILKGWGWY